MSIDWYVRLEQGRVGTPGSAVLDAIAAALILSSAERTHLHLIARGEAPPPEHMSAPVGGSLLAVPAGMPVLPAFVVDFRFDVLAHNAAAAALFGEGFARGTARNVARSLFLDSRTRAQQLDWDRYAQETVGNLRANLARHRDDPRLNQVIAELRANSRAFAEWWDDQRVQQRCRGTKRVKHDTAGIVTLSYDMLAALDGSDQRLMTLTAADPSTEHALRSLIADHTTAALTQRSAG